MSEQYLEDFAVGQTFGSGRLRVDKERIKTFAAEFDPQPFHLDEEAAKGTLLRGLAASGWHTTALFMRMMCEGFLLRSASMGSPGIDELRWLRPVRPGDTLSGTATVVSARASSRRPEMGIVTFLFEISNQRGEPVMRIKNPIMFARRAAS